MEYLNDSVQNALNCCIPLDYPVEAALGTIDFLAEDVWLNDAAINAELWFQTWMGSRDRFSM